MSTPIKKCDYCPSEGEMPTFMSGETICTKCLRKLPSDLRSCHLVIASLRARLAALENLHDEYNLLTATYMSLQNQYYDAQKRLAEIEGQARPFYDVDPNWLYSVIRYARKTWFEVDVAEGLREMEEDEAFMLPNLYAAPVQATPTRSRLVRDGPPSVYISKDLPACTHRMSESDIPVWCQSGDDVLALLDILDNKLSPVPAIPEGWKLVPVEPTDEMGRRYWDVMSDRKSTMLDAYKALLAAAPQPEGASK